MRSWVMQMEGAAKVDGNKRVTQVILTSSDIIQGCWDQRLKDSGQAGASDPSW